MKKLLALCMTLALVLGLACPAWAAEGTYTVNGEPVPTLPAEADPADYFTVDVADLLDGAMDPALAETSLYLSETEFTEQYLEEHPEHYAAFDPDAYFEEYWGGDYYTKEEYMTDYALTTQEEFKQDMWQEYLWSLSSQYDELSQEVAEAYGAYLVETYRAGHPGELEGLTQEELLLRKGYTHDQTPAEQFMEDWGLDSTEEVLPALLTEYVRDRLAVEGTHAAFLLYQEQYPEKWEVFDAAAWLAEEWTWYDSKEDYMNAHGLRSEQEFVEDMFVDYVSTEAWKWEPDTPPYEPVVSSDPLTLTANGQAVEGAVLTAENGVSYTDAATLNAILGTDLTGDKIAIREAAAAAGWDAGWNPIYNTVYLLDKEAVMGQLEEATAAVTAVLDWAKAHQPALENGQALKSTETAEVVLTAFNSLDGDETYSVTVTVESVMDNGGMSVTAKADVADLLKLLEEDALTAAAEEMPDLTLGELKSLLAGVEVKLYWDFAQGMALVYAPVMALFLEEWEAETWYAIDLGTESAALMGDGVYDFDMAGMLYAALLEDSQDSWFGPEGAYMEFMTAVEALKGICGKDTLITDGSTVTWQVTTQDMNALMAQAAGTEGSFFKDYHITVTMREDGHMAADVGMRPDMEGMTRAMGAASPYLDEGAQALIGWALGLFDCRVTAASEGTVEAATATAEYHWKNQFKLTVESESKQTVTDESPAQILPADAAVKLWGE